MSRYFLRFLIAEILVVVAVASTFRIIESRLVAGAITGTMFIALGFYIVMSGLRNPGIRRSMTFVFGCVHLFIVAIPLVVFRLLNSGLEFQHIKIWGLPGPVFHRLSTLFFSMLLIATLAEFIYRRWNERNVTSLEGAKAEDRP